jgi:hypothetical protein
LLTSPPDLFVGVDASDFNLSVERLLRQKGAIPFLMKHCVGRSLPFLPFRKMVNFRRNAIAMCLQRRA